MNGGRFVGPWLLIAGSAAACQAERETVGDGGGTSSAEASGSTGSASETSGTSTSSGTESSTGGIRFDIGGAGDMTAATAGDAGPGEGCEKIDFLFVIDNSGSMGAHQQRLANAFGPFMDTIFSTVKAKDYNIMVVDSDAAGDIDTCEPCSPNSFWCGDWCTTKASLDVTCERTLGAGEVAPYNNEGSNRICGVPDGKRYLTSALDQDTIKALFPCMAKVGIFGSGAELPMSAMVAAIGPQAAPDGCNAGFLRDDAVLVVTVISDDYPVPMTQDDASTVGTVDQWYEGLVAAKLGRPQNVVMLGIVNTADATCVTGAGDPITHPTEKFVDLVERFGIRGITGNICSSDYNAFFADAVGLIDTTCNDFVPPG